MISTEKIKRIKRLPYFLLVMVIVCFTLFALKCYTQIGSYTTIPVNVYQLNERTYKTIELGHNSFQTGTEGRLRWKVDSFKESFLIEVTNPNAIFKLTELIFLFLFLIVVFVSVADLKENTDIRKHVSRFIFILAYLVIFYPGLLLLNAKISDDIIKNLTNNQFTSSHIEFAIVKYAIINSILIIIASVINSKDKSNKTILIPSFLNKAKSLQQDQDLTI